MSEDAVKLWRQYPQLLDASVAAWHAGCGDGMELHEYLGLTWAEYQDLTGPPS